MSKIIKIILVVIFLLIFFFLPIIPSDFLPKTKEGEIFCQTHSCGAIMALTPFQFVKSYINTKL